MMTRFSGVLVAVVVLTAGSFARGAAPLKEDLSGCKLPHGELTLPLPDSAEAAKGMFLKLSEGTMVVWPVGRDGQPLAGIAAAEKLRALGKGDVAFNADDDGTLWVLSGRALDLGTMYLHDAAAEALTRPLEMHGMEGKPAGLYGHIEEGRTLLVETADTHYALVRVLEKSSAGLRVQYVYQPSGKILFDVPNATLVLNGGVEPVAQPVGGELPAPVGVAPALVSPSVSHVQSDLPPVHSHRTVLEPSVEVYAEQRRMLIERRLGKLNAPTNTAIQIADKVQAIDELVEIQAVEAIEPFISQITFLDTRRTNKEFSQDNVHPFYAALKKMGKPAAEGAIKELSRMDLSAGKDDSGVDGPLYRAKLLGQVVRSVEGDDVAEFLFKRERDRTTDANRKAVYDQLINSKN